MATAKEYPQFSNNLELKTLENLAQPHLYPRFSGTLKYEIDFKSEELGIKSIIDLGEVYEVAEIWLNDENIGVRICPPYKFDVTKYLRKGTNHLKVEVTNTLVKDQQDFLSQLLIQEPTGLMGPVNIICSDKK